MVRSVQGRFIQDLGKDKCIQEAIVAKDMVMRSYMRLTMWESRGANAQMCNSSE